MFLFCFLFLNLSLTLGASHCFVVIVARSAVSLPPLAGHAGLPAFKVVRVRINAQKMAGFSHNTFRCRSHRGVYRALSQFVCTRKWKQNVQSHASCAKRADVNREKVHRKCIRVQGLSECECRVSQRSFFVRIYFFYGHGSR